MSGSQRNVTRRLHLRESLLGIEGLALMRQLLEGDDQAARARIEEVRWILDPARDADFGETTEVAELGVVDLYREWAASYDASSRPVRAIEQPVVWSIFEQLPPGRALDAACGTGRHARRLVDLGHRVVGIDSSPEMLDRARQLVAEAGFEVGDLCKLPVETASMDLAVCALALDHAPTLLEPLAELARTVRPGGTVVVSDVHPVISVMSGVAHVKFADGVRGFVRNHNHLHGEYLHAFAEVGLDVHRCFEPLYGEAEFALKKTAMHFIPEATKAAYLGLPGALVWHLIRRS